MHQYVAVCQNHNCANYQYEQYVAVCQNHNCANYQYDQYVAVCRNHNCANYQYVPVCHYQYCFACQCALMSNHDQWCAVAYFVRLARQSVLFGSQV